jgi:hypothetical protein
MKRKLNTVWLCILVLSGIGMAQMRATFHIEGDGVGYLLLNGVIVTFEHDKPLSPEAFKTMVLDSLNRLNKEADLALEQKHIDQNFYTRYRRVLLVLRLVMVKAKGVEDTILDDTIIEEVNKFDSQAEMKKGDPVEGLGSVAGAVAEELLSLKRYLDEQAGKKEN